jgi:hypothetical protein
MSDSNCICFQCKRPLIETDSYGQLIWGCLNCKLWWLVRYSVRPRLSREQLRALNQAPNQMPCSASTEAGARREGLKKAANGTYHVLVK